MLNKASLKKVEEMEEDTEGFFQSLIKTERIWIPLVFHNKDTVLWKSAVKL